MTVSWSRDAEMSVLYVGEELEEPNLGIFILQIRASQEVGTDHLQAVPPGFVAA